MVTKCPFCNTFLKEPVHKVFKHPESGMCVAGGLVASLHIWTILGFQEKMLVSQEKLLGRIPKTADGVPVLTGDIVWIPGCSLGMYDPPTYLEGTVDGKSAKAFAASTYIHDGRGWKWNQWFDVSKCFKNRPDEQDKPPHDPGIKEWRDELNKAIEEGKLKFGVDWAKGIRGDEVFMAPKPSAEPAKPIWGRSDITQVINWTRAMKELEDITRDWLVRHGIIGKLPDENNPPVKTPKT